jgi:hypothetical protein
MSTDLPIPRPRREFLYGLGATLGTAALNGLLDQEGRAAASAPTNAPARRCVFLFLEGGPSQIDTFDPKPELARLHGKSFRRSDPTLSAMAGGPRRFVQSPFRFSQRGQGGIWMNDLFTHLGDAADHLCLYRGLQAESVDHPTACYQLNTGNRLAGDPAVGAWVSYGLGTEYENLPAFIVLPDAAHPQGGPANWSSGFLPAQHAALPLRPDGPPLPDLLPHYQRPPEITAANLHLLQQLNRSHRAQHPQHAALEARMSAYETAYRMQAQVPHLLDISGESAAMLSRYGVGETATDSFARRCLLARRLLEQGVRFVQLYSGGWDSHDYLEASHTARIKSIDRPVAALITDLFERGMLADTLVVLCGEFGRSPDNGLREGDAALGRDHNAQAMSVILAGGGVPAGTTLGATDEIGSQAVELVHPLRDFHVTLLKLLGLDDNRLTYFHSGRFKQLSQTGGMVIDELCG